MPGPLEILVIAVVFALVFGASRLPSAARRIGTGVREVKEATGLDDVRGEIAGIRRSVSPSEEEPPVDDRRPRATGEAPKSP